MNQPIPVLRTQDLLIIANINKKINDSNVVLRATIVAIDQSVYQKKWKKLSKVVGPPMIPILILTPT